MYIKISIAIDIVQCFVQYIEIMQYSMFLPLILAFSSESSL